MLDCKTIIVRFCEKEFPKSIRGWFSGSGGTGVDGGGDSEILLNKEEDNQHEPEYDNNGLLFLSFIFFFHHESFENSGEYVLIVGAWREAYPNTDLSAHESLD